MTHGAYLQVLRLKMDELGIIEYADVVDASEAQELIALLPTIALEHVVNSPDGVHWKHSWDEKWVKLCQDEYATRTLLLL
jgi:hypothetical protein